MFRDGCACVGVVVSDSAMMGGSRLVSSGIDGAGVER